MMQLRRGTSSRLWGSSGLGEHDWEAHVGDLPHQAHQHAGQQVPDGDAHYPATDVEDQALGREDAPHVGGKVLAATASTREGRSRWISQTEWSGAGDDGLSTVSSIYCTRKWKVGM